jgi:hypothetical protein
MGEDAKIKVFEIILCSILDAGKAISANKINDKITHLFHLAYGVCFPAAVHVLLGF